MSDFGNNKFIAGVKACPKASTGIVVLIIILVILVICFCFSCSLMFLMRAKLCEYFSPCVATTPATTTTKESYQNLRQYGYH